MNQPLKLEAPWEEVKELLKETNAALTDEDLQFTHGQDDVLLERLATKMGRDKEHVRGWVESVSANKRKAS